MTQCAQVPLVKQQRSSPTQLHSWGIITQITDFTRSQTRGRPKQVLVFLSGLEFKLNKTLKEYTVDSEIKCRIDITN